MEPRPYAVPLEDLVRSAHVPVEDQVAAQDTSQDQEPEPDLWPQLRWPH